MMNQWICSTLLTEYVNTAGKPIKFPGRLRVEDSPLSMKGAQYLRNLGCNVTEKIDKTNSSKDTIVEVSLP